MPTHPSFPKEDCHYRIAPNIFPFFAMLAGALFINISIWINDLPGKAGTLAGTVVVLYLLCYYNLVGLKFYKTKIIVRRPFALTGDTELQLSDIIRVRIINTSFTRYATRVSVKRKGFLFPRTIALRCGEERPKELYQLLKERCDYAVELRVD